MKTKLSWFRRTPLPERQGETNPWSLSVDEGIKKFGSATKLMEAMFEDGRPFGNEPMSKLFFLYLKEQYFKNLNDGK